MRLVLRVHPRAPGKDEDGEAGMQAAWAAGMQVVDVRGMKGYPITAALRTVIDEVRADPSKRPWLQ